MTDPSFYPTGAAIASEFANKPPGFPGVEFFRNGRPRIAAASTAWDDRCIILVRPATTTQNVIWNQGSLSLFQWLQVSALMGAVLAFTPLFLLDMLRSLTD